MAKKVVVNKSTAKKTPAPTKPVKSTVKVVKNMPKTTSALKTKSVSKQAVKPVKPTKDSLLKKKTTPAVKVKIAPVKKSAPKVVAKELVPKKQKVSKVEQQPVVVVAEKSISKADKKIVIEPKPLPEIVNPDKLKQVKSILISLPKPESGKSPYIDIAEQFKIKLDWRPFTKVEGIKAGDFRKQKIYIDQYPCVIFTSRVAIEQYFRICEELRIKINEDNRYFCLSEAIALYLQKFIQYRKRKVFYGDGKLPKFMEVILKHKEDGKFLIPCSDLRDKALIELLNKHNITFGEAVIYKTIASNLSDLKDVKYDMLVFFNASAIESLYSNFPNFKQEDTRLAIFGNSTADALKARKLNINIFAPTPENPSLVDAIKKYIIKSNKRGK